MANPFKLPLLSGANVVEPNQHIEIGMNAETLGYFVVYPSGYAKREQSLKDIKSELKKHIPDEEKLEDVIRYATNWRRTAYFPHRGQQFIMFPDGQIYWGGGGNHSAGFNVFKDLED